MEDSTPNPAPGTSPSLDPALADAKLGGEAAKARPLGQRIHASTRSALETMHTAASELAHAITTVSGEGVRRQHPTRGSSTVGDVRVVGSKLRSFSGSEPDLVDAAQKRFGEVARKVDKSLADLTEAETTLADAVATKLTDQRAESPTGVALGSEVRQFVRGLDRGKRLGLVKERIEAGDLATVSAVLNSASFLSGLDESEASALRGLAEKKFAPVESEALASARQARQMIESAGTSFASAWNSRIAKLGPGNQKRDEAVAKLAGGAA